MSANHASPVVPAPNKSAASPVIILLTPKEVARLLKVSLSWLAKARMRGDGPPFIKISPRSIRYADAAIAQWTKGRQRLSTSEQS
jgi:predicted DNA-binding transcriptional regulator AlpA